MDDGSVWEVDSIDRVYSGVWVVSSNVLACDTGYSGYIVHKDDGEKVSATKIQ